MDEELDWKHCSWEAGEVKQVDGEFSDFRADIFSDAPYQSGLLHWMLPCNNNMYPLSLPKEQWERYLLLQVPQVTNWNSAHCSSAVVRWPVMFGLSYHGLECKLKLKLRWVKEAYMLYLCMLSSSAMLSSMSRTSGKENEVLQKMSNLNIWLWWDVSSW